MTVILLLLTAGFSQADNFSYRRSLVIDYTKVGTNNSGTLPDTGFPVLVSLSGDWLKTTAGGEKVRGKC